MEQSLLLASRGCGISWLSVPKLSLLPEHAKTAALLASRYCSAFQSLDLKNFFSTPFSLPLFSPPFSAVCLPRLSLAFSLHFPSPAGIYRAEEFFSAGFPDSFCCFVLLAERTPVPLKKCLQLVYFCGTQGYFWHRTSNIYEWAQSTDELKLFDESTSRINTIFPS